MQILGELETSSRIYTGTLRFFQDGGVFEASFVNF